MQLVKLKIGRNSAGIASLSHVYADPYLFRSSRYEATLDASVGLYW